jgi:glycosyltransferase involved in cell wall biosynthesis
MKIGILNRADVTDLRTLSGAPYFMAKALEEHVGEVVYLSPDDSLVTTTIENAGRCLDHVSHALLGRHISCGHNRILSKRLAYIFTPRVAQSGCDVIFAPQASVELAYLSTDIPIIYFSDLTWANIVDYYPGCTRLFEFTRAEGERIEAAALSKASALVFPSTWAANTAIEHYKTDTRKIHCIPYGANFERADLPNREAAMHHPLKGVLRLLWIGVDWVRKGGPIAHECLMELLREGVDARLVVCGCVPPRRYRHPKIEVIPFLSKRDPAQLQRLSQLFLDANFFLFPTMAEASAIVLCESSAHGLPALVRNTGGVGGVITDGENGYLLPANAKGKQYAEKILEIVRDRSAYDDLVRRSRLAYEERLNWDAWGRAMRPIFEQVNHNRSSRAESREVSDTRGE